MSGCRGTLFEPRLVDPSLEEVGSRHCHFRHNGLFKDLRHVGSHHDGSYVLQLRLIQSLVLGEWHESPVIQVLWNRGWAVEEVKDLGRDVLREAV